MTSNDGSNCRRRHCLKRHLQCVVQRLQSQAWLVPLMRAQFEQRPHGEVTDWVLYWPHSGVGGCGNDDDRFVLMPMDSYVCQREEEWVHYAFLLAPPLQPPRPPQKKQKIENSISDDGKIYLARWDCPTGDLPPLPYFAMNVRVFYPQRVTVHTHKLCCVLPPVSSCRISHIECLGGQLTLSSLADDDKQYHHDLVLTDCVVRLPADATQFSGLRLYLGDEHQDSLLLDYEMLRSVGRLDLDLRVMAGPGKSCRLLTRAPLTILLFADPLCSVVLRSRGETRMELQGAAQLQYQCWAGDQHSLMQPYRYQIETDALLPIPLTSTPSPPRPDQDRSPLRVPRDSFCAAVDRYLALQRMNVALGSSTEDMPRFALDGALVPVVERHQCPWSKTSTSTGNMLVMRDYTLASYELDHAAANIHLKLVLPEDSQRVNPILHYVY